MPEYLTPGVYLEETSFRSRSIEGVPTSTFGMAGLTCYGPVAYQLATPTGDDGPQADPGHQLHRVRAGLRQPGRRRHRQRHPQLPGLRGKGVLRQRRPPAVRRPGSSRSPGTTASSSSTPTSPSCASGRRRWPPGGPAGPARPVRRSACRSASSAARTSWSAVNGTATLKGVEPGAAVEIVAGPHPDPQGHRAGRPTSGSWTPARPGCSATATPAAASTRSPTTAPQAVCHITLSVTVQMGDVRAGQLPRPGAGRSGPSRRRPGSIFRVLQAEQPTDELSLIWLDSQPTAGRGQPSRRRRAGACWPRCWR